MMDTGMVIITEPMPVLIIILTTITAMKVIPFTTDRVDQ